MLWTFCDKVFKYSLKVFKYQHQYWYLNCILDSAVFDEVFKYIDVPVGIGYNTVHDSPEANSLSQSKVTFCYAIVS